MFRFPGPLRSLLRPLRRQASDEVLARLSAPGGREVEPQRRANQTAAKLGMKGQTPARGLGVRRGSRAVPRRRTGNPVRGSEPSVTLAPTDPVSALFQRRGRRRSRGFPLAIHHRKLRLRCLSAAEFPLATTAFRFPSNADDAVPCCSGVCATTALERERDKVASCFYQPRCCPAEQPHLCRRQTWDHRCMRLP